MNMKYKTARPRVPSGALTAHHRSGLYQRFCGRLCCQRARKCINKIILYMMDIYV